MRMVVDFSDLDQSMQNITLGESGQVFSPYYRDQFPAWYNGKSFPMLFSDAALRRTQFTRSCWNRVDELRDTGARNSLASQESARTIDEIICRRPCRCDATLRISPAV